MQLSLSGGDAEAVAKAAEALAGLARSVPLVDPEPGGVEVLGPVPAPVARLRDRFRWHLLLLGDRQTTRSVARELARQAHRRFRSIQLRVDPGPLQML